MTDYNNNYSSDVQGLALNVWDASSGPDPEWLMAIYLDTSYGIETNCDLAFNPTPEQIARYLEISDDSDWWVDNSDPDFNYILWGIRP